MHTLQDISVIRDLLKKHIPEDPSKCQLKWQYRGQDEVVEVFQDFLTGVATTRHTLSKKILLKASKAHWEGGPEVLNAWAQSMVDALRAIRHKMHSFRSGAKTTTEAVHLMPDGP